MSDKEIIPCYSPVTVLPWKVLNHILINNNYERESSQEIARSWRCLFDKKVKTQDEAYFIPESYESRIGDKQSFLGMISHHISHSDDLLKIIKQTITDKKSYKKYISEMEEDVEFLSTLYEPSKYQHKEGIDDVYAIRELNARSVRIPLLAAHRKWGKSEDYSSMISLLVESFKIFNANDCMDQFNRIMFDITEMINKGESLDKIKDELSVEYDHDHTNPNI